MSYITTVMDGIDNQAKSSDRFTLTKRARTVRRI
jgi:hypothetical protein